MYVMAQDHHTDSQQGRAADNEGAPCDDLSTVTIGTSPNICGPPHAAGLAVSRQVNRSEQSAQLEQQFVIGTGDIGDTTRTEPQLASVH